MNTQQQKLTEEQREDRLRVSIGNASAFRQMIIPKRFSRFGTVIMKSNQSILFGQQSPPLRPLKRIELKMIKQEATDEELNNFQISPWVGWAILFFSVFISALAPAWMAWDIKSESFTRNSWRYFFQTVLLIPFWLFQRRNSEQQQKQEIAKVQNILVIFKNALQYVVHYFFFILSAKLTSINHAIFLSNIIVFWKLLFRMYSSWKYKHQKIHQFQKGGAGMVIIGVLMLFFDSVNNPVLQNPTETVLYLGRSKAVRLFGDLLGIFAAFLLTYMQHNFKLLGDLPTPRLQTTLVYNGFISLSLSSLGYFCGGSEISFNSLYGMFGLFTISNFIKIFYISILLGLGMMISNIFTTIIFPVVVIKIAEIIEPLVTSCILHYFGTQDIPSGFTCIGFSFMVPGLLMIIAGRNAILEVPIKFKFNLTDSYI